MVVAGGVHLRLIYVRGLHLRVIAVILTRGGGPCIVMARNLSLYT